MSPGSELDAIQWIVIFFVLLIVTFLLIFHYPQ
jgi:hypothetical protein